jgi:PAS domain S-box-containing protein
MATDDATLRSHRAIQVEAAQRGLGLVLGCSLTLLGLVVFAGWIFRQQALVILLGPMPVSANAAIGLIASGVGLVGIASDRQRMTVGAALIAFVIGGLTLYQYLLGADFRIDTLLFNDFTGRQAIAGRMPAVTALELALSALSLLAFVSGRRFGLRYSIAGVFATSVVALALVDIMVFFTGVFGLLREGLLLGGALPESFAFLALGAWVTFIAWQRDAAQPDLPRWLPVAAGLGFLVTTVFLWRALASEQNERQATRLHTQARIVHRDLSLRLDLLIRSTERLARRTASSAPVAEWVRDASLLVRDAPEVTGIVWTRPSTDSLIVAPPGFDPVVAGFDLARVLSDSTMSSRGATTVAAMDPAGRRFALLSAACSEASCRGQLAVLVLGDVFVRSIFTPEDSEYVVTVSSRGERVFASPLERDRRAPVDSLQFISGNLRWDVAVSPTANSLALGRTALPEVVLGLGLLVSVLLTISLRLAQTAWVRAREFERQRLVLALESATDGVWEWDVESGRLDRTPAIWRRLGYEPGQVESSLTAWTSRIHPDDTERFSSALASHLEGKTPSFELEYRVRAQNGAWHWIVDHGRVVEYTVTGQPRRMLGLSGDVTERKRADQVLAESEQRFRAIFDSAFQFQSLMDLDCNLLEANRASLEFAGLSLEDVRGKPIWESYWWSESTERVERLKSACLDAARGKVVQYQDEIRGIEDRRATIDFSIKPIRDAEGRVIQLLAEGRDITERKRAEAALREVDTLSTMGRLAARVAHEINNPLAGIQNSFLLIKDAIPTTHPHFKYVGAIEREIQRIARVTRQLYETYRHGQEPERHSSVGMVISDAVSLLSQVNRASRVTIHVDASGAPSVIPLPDAIVRQAVFNLVQNAVDASPSGGEVWVRTWTEGGKLRLSVRDEGAGVPHELRERVFDPFYSTKRGIPTGGMGLGLSLVRRSVQALGGRVWIAGDGDAGGADFHVEIPLTPISSEATR